MKIRFVDNCLVITTNQKPKKGDWMCCFAHGIKDRGNEGQYIGRGHYLAYHDGKPVNKLNAICDGTEKVILKFGKYKKD
jgi:hypothetical protein